jgi:hypothetical protein
MAQLHLPSQLLQAAPLLITESREDYEQIRYAFIQEIAPRGMLERLYVEDVATLGWDILRLQRCKAALVNSSFRSALVRVLTNILHTTRLKLCFDEKEEQLAHNWFSDLEARSEVLKRLKRFHLDETAIEAEAMRICAADLERLDRMLASAESRRNRMLRSIAEYRADLALQLRARSDRIVEGKALAIEPGKDKKPPSRVLKHDKRTAASSQPS